jgi:hypothetical protein
VNLFVYICVPKWIFQLFITKSAMKYLKSAVLFSLAFAALSSCKSTGSDARDAARQDVATTEAPAAIADPQGTQAQQPEVPAGPTTTISFGEDRHNFGKVKDGEKVTHTFKFRNAGNEPLILSDARSTCGCTVPTWPREPIAPGKTGEITVVFDATGKVGGQSKRVTIVANTTPPETFIYLEGEVEAKAGN